MTSPQEGHYSKLYCFPHLGRIPGLLPTQRHSRVGIAFFGQFVTLFKAQCDHDKAQKVFSLEGAVTRDRTLGRFSTVTLY